MRGEGEVLNRWEKCIYREGEREREMGNDMWVWVGVTFGCALEGPVRIKRE